MLWNWSNYDEVDDMRKLGTVSQYSKKMLIEKCVTNVAYPLNVETQ